MNVLRCGFLMASIFFCGSAYGAAPVNVCLTGKIELMLPSYKATFLNGINLAVSKYPSGKYVTIKTYFYDNKPLSPIRKYKEMLAEHCVAIIGYEYLSDLMLIARIQQNTKIPIFTSYASSSAADVLPDNFFIFSPSYDFQAKKMMDFIHKKFGKIANVLLVTEVDRLDLAKYKHVYKQLLDKDHIHYDEYDFLESDTNVEENFKRFSSKKHYDYAFIFSGAVGSTKIINLLNDHKTIFIGTENFGSSSNQSLYVRLKDKNIQAYTIRNIDFLKRNKLMQDFYVDYTKKYASEPTAFSVYAFDAAAIILNTLANYKVISLENIKKINYNGVTGGYIDKGEFYRSHLYVILALDKNGFSYEE